MKRTDLLRQANASVSKENEANYAQEDYECIASLWGSYLNSEITSGDVAMMMSLAKVISVRKDRGNIENYVEIAALAACACEFSTGGEETEE